jgi:hypothetical protein
MGNDVVGAWERRENCKGFGGKARRKEPLGTPRCRWEDGIKMTLGRGVWSGFIWLRIGTGGGLL